MNQELIELKYLCLLKSFSINLGPSSSGIIRPTTIVTDGNWHSIYILRNGPMVAVFIDNFAPMNFDLAGRFTGLDTDGVYYFGKCKIVDSTFGAQIPF